MYDFKFMDDWKFKLVLASGFIFVYIVLPLLAGFFAVWIIDWQMLINLVKGGE